MKFMQTKFRRKTKKKIPKTKWEDWLLLIEEDFSGGSNKEWKGDVLVEDFVDKQKTKSSWTIDQNDSTDFFVFVSSCKFSNVDSNQKNVKETIFFIECSSYRWMFVLNQDEVELNENERMENEILFLKSENSTEPFRR